MSDKRFNFRVEIGVTDGFSWFDNNKSVFAPDEITARRKVIHDIQATEGQHVKCLQLQTKAGKKDEGEGSFA